MFYWHLDPDYAHLDPDLGSLDAVFALDEEFITRDGISRVVRINREGVRYYVKRYHRGGEGLRAYLGRPKIKAEWINLRRFERWGMPVPHIVAYGLERRFGIFRRGALVTREAPDTTDLAQLVRNGDPRLRDPRRVDRIGRQLAKATRTMHDHRFTHNDLKWRNLLVDTQGRLFFIDCPSGGFSFGPLLKRRIVKDLACLDKVAKYHLSRTQRLRFYLQYRGYEKLTAADKKCIRQILRFFEGRE